MPFQTQFMTKPAIVYKDSPPSDKKVLWYDTNENTLKVFRPETSAWEAPAIVYKDSPPSDKKVLWYDTNEKILKVFRPETSAWEAVTDIDKIIGYILVLGGD